MPGPAWHHARPGLAPYPAPRQARLDFWALYERERRTLREEGAGAPLLDSARRVCLAVTRGNPGTI